MTYIASELEHAAKAPDRHLPVVLWDAEQEPVVTPALGDQKVDEGLVEELDGFAAVKLIAIRNLDHSFEPR